MQAAYPANVRLDVFGEADRYSLDATRFNLLAWDRKYSNAVRAIGRHLREPDDARRCPTIPDRCLRIRTAHPVGVRSDIFGETERFRWLLVSSYNRTQLVACRHFGMSARCGRIGFGTVAVHRLMMELEGGHRNSVIKRRNPIEFGLVFNDAKEV
ncbi:hypothetical protein EVAR_30364_1 [Eumeta japonica]|uniref:Uncharacterized protein n=1 Tax=Eumeta variegata TaxID=151549 RepID=A0A4C1W3X6_EUMVA|nr:hypothetical protein EVAR_30364_1 [Eumeta japonica]